MTTNPMSLCMALSLAAACSSGGGKDDTGGGGSICADFGASIAASDSCDEDASVYEESCEAELAAQEALGCLAEAETYFQCASTAGYDWDCSSGFPQADLGDGDPCETELEAYAVCNLVD
jgi:hypothetical protein